MVQFGDPCTIEPKIIVAVIEPARIDINKATAIGRPAIASLRRSKLLLAANTESPSLFDDEMQQI